VTVEIRVEGQASKRGMIPRMPAPDKLLADAQAWVEAEYGSIVRNAAVVSQGSCPELRLQLHPAAAAVTLTAGEDGRVSASATTSGVGPGYHTFVGRVLERLGEELAIAWTPPSDRRAGSPAPWVGSRQPLADRAVVEREHLVQLRRVLERARDQRGLGLHAIPIGLLPGTRFEHDGAVLTPLGPRDDAWLDRAVKLPRAAIDILPWWLDITDARYQLTRALVILWTEVRWRTPTTDEERAAVDEALSLLRNAIRADGSLAYPWREWAELARLRALPDAIPDRVLPSADAADPTQPLIGYRRRPVEVVHEGWLLPAVPGTFSEARMDGEWRGGEGGRQVTFAATATETPDGRPMTAERFLTDVAGDLGEGVLQHDAGEVRGRARLTTDTSSGVEVAVLEGFSAVTGSGCAIRVEFSESDDWRWAIDLWRSLRPA
jgi:hypothetical protein